MTRTFFTALFLIIIVFLDSHQVKAQEVLNQINKSGELKVGVSGNQPPYSMEAIDGSLIGFDIELAELIADAMDVDLELVQIPFSDLLSELEKGNIDIILSGMAMTTQRNMEFAFVGPYHISGISILSKSASHTERSSVSVLDNKNIRLAALKNSTSEAFAKSQFPSAKLTTVDKYETALESMRSGDIDALVADFSECTFATFKHPEDDFFVMRDLLTNERIGLATRPDDPLLLNLISNLFEEFEETGVFIQLENEWFTNSSWIDRVNY